MPLDPKSRETQSWLKIAKLDLEAVKNLLTQPQLSAQASFHAQQSAEKALKAFLVWHQVRFQKEHDIRYLGDLALPKDSSLRSAIEKAVDLNPYAIATRYPEYTDMPTPEDAREALVIAEALYLEILSKLPASVHPYAAFELDARKRSSRSRPR